MTEAPSNGSADSPLYISGEAGKAREERLSPLALRSVGSGTVASLARARRINAKALAGSDRLPFEHDRDRIFHSRQFRKLSGKTQMLIAPSHGALRTRLTHSLEVYQIATSVARRLNLNIPAVEAIALAHDVGHPPFGHAGETALNRILAPLGGFHHAVHSVRSLDTAAYDARIRDAEATCGLNLTYAVREGVLSHGWFPEHEPSPYHLPFDAGDAWQLSTPLRRHSSSVEGQVVALADSIAYLNHDIFDLLAFGFHKIISSSIVADFFGKHHDEGVGEYGQTDWFKVKSIFIDLLKTTPADRVKTLVRDAQDTSHAALVAHHSAETTPGDAVLVSFSEPVRRARELFYDFFAECVYSDVRIQHKNQIAENCIEFLYDFIWHFYSGNPDLLPSHIQNELQAPPPWWRPYLSTLGDAYLDKLAHKGESFVTTLTEERARILGTENDIQIACRLAPVDVIALLSDAEALALRRGLDRPEAFAGNEPLTEALAAFPNNAEYRRSQDWEAAIRNDLGALLTTAN